MKKEVSALRASHGDMLVITLDEKPDADHLPLGRVVCNHQPINFEEEYAEQLESLATSLTSGGFCGLECHVGDSLIEMTLGSVGSAAFGAEHD